MRTDDLHGLKDDMTAFIEGHGMRRFPAYVGDEIASVLWKDDDNPDAWKDFVELAKASGAPFLTMDEVVLTKEDLEVVMGRLKDNVYRDDLGDARLLHAHTAKIGFLQPGLALQVTLICD